MWLLTPARVDCKSARGGDGSRLKNSVVKCCQYLVISRDQNAEQSHSIKIDNSSFEMVEQSKYLGTTLTNQNSIQEEIKSRLKSGNASCHSVQNLLSSSLLSKNIKINLLKTKRRLLYLKSQFVPRSKHFSSRL